MELNTLLQYKPYSTARTEKRALYAGLLTGLTQFHREHCPEYGRLLDALGNEVPLADLHYRDTLPGGRCDIDPACAAFMEPVRRFWLRLALPDVWEEDEL